MRSIPSFFLLLFFIALTTAQAQMLTLSEEIALRNDVFYDIVGEFNGRVLLMRTKSNNEVEVQGLDERLRVSWTKSLELDQKVPQVVGTSAAASYFSLFYQFRYKGDVYLKAHRYTPSANLLDSVTLKSYGDLFYTPEIEVVISQDKEKALFYFTERYRIINAVCFDIKNMQVLWEQSLSPEGYDSSEDLLHAMVDNRGNMHMVIEKDNYRSKRETHHLEVYQYFFEENGLYQLIVNMPEDKLTYDAFFTYDNLNNQLVAAGLFGENSLLKAEGYYYFRAEDKSNEYFLSIKNFDEDFVAYLTGKEVDEDKLALYDIQINDLVLRRDGGILLIGEEAKISELTRPTYTRTIYDTYDRPYATDFLYEDIFIIAIHPDGEPHWKKVMHKRQYSQDDGGIYSSFFLFKNPSSLRMIFNDEVKPENTVSEYIINSLGEYERRSILSTENLKLQIRFRDAVQVSSNSLLIPSERRSRLRLVRLEF